MKNRADDNLGAKLLQPITNPEKLRRLRESVSTAIYSEPISKPSGNLLYDKLGRNLILVRRENWIAVPTLNFPDVALILKHQEKTRSIDGDGKLYATVLPIFGSPDFCYENEVPLTIEGIQEFDYVLACSCFEPVLFSGEPQPDWIIASSEAEYHIVAGTPETVEYLLGCTAEKAFADFRTFADQFSNSDPEAVLSPTYHRYYNFIYEQLYSYQNASPGSKVFLTLS